MIFLLYYTKLYSPNPGDHQLCLLGFLSCRRVYTRVIWFGAGLCNNLPSAALDESPNRP